MKPIPVSVQLYSVREEAAKDFPATLKKVASYGYVGVEFAGFHGKTAKELRSILDDLGLVASSAHGAMPGKENVGQILDDARTLGYTRHVSGFGPEQFATLEKTLEAAAVTQKAAELLKGSGVSLSIHNHWWEFDKKFDGKYPHEVFMAAAPDAFAQLDTYWIAVGGADAAKVVRQYGRRAPLLHIKDGPADREKAMTAVGRGVMDWPKVIGAAANSTEWLIVELDRCDTDMFEAVAESCRYLVSKGLGKGKTKPDARG